MEVSVSILALMFKMFYPATPGDVLPAVKIFPDGKCLGIVLQLWIGYGTCDMIAYICLMHFIIIRAFTPFP